MFKKSIVFASLLACHVSAFAATTESTDHHFYVQMQNRSSKNVTMSFRRGEGNVSLDPVLADNTPLKTVSPKYGVNIVPMVPTATFNIIFKGQNECNFNIGFFAPGKPRVTMQGLGCLGGGYQIADQGTTLVLFVSDINHKV